MSGLARYLLTSTGECRLTPDDLRTQLRCVLGRLTCCCCTPVMPTLMQHEGKCAHPQSVTLGPSATFKARRIASAAREKGQSRTVTTAEADRNAFAGSTSASIKHVAHLTIAACTCWQLAFWREQTPISPTVARLPAYCALSTGLYRRGCAGNPETNVGNMHQEGYLSGVATASMLCGAKQRRPAATDLYRAGSEQSGSARRVYKQIFRACYTARCASTTPAHQVLGLCAAHQESFDADNGKGGPVFSRPLLPIIRLSEVRATLSS